AAVAKVFRLQQHGGLGELVGHGGGRTVGGVVVHDHCFDRHVGAGEKRFETLQELVLGVVADHQCRDDWLGRFRHRPRIIPLESRDVQRLGARQRLAQLLRNRLVQQNLVLFLGGLIAGIGGFVYHAIAGRGLGPSTYGQVAFLIALYAVGTAPALILVVVLARYTATLAARGAEGISSLLTRTIRLIAIPSLVAILFTTLLARPVASFEHLGSTIPVLILGFSIALIWQVSIPRGILQGLQRFTALSLNLSLELVVRTATVVALLAANYAVSGAMAAVLLGLVFAFALGLIALRDHLGRSKTRVHLRGMAGFPLAAAAGIIGVQILYNQDVILAEHYLSSHAGGIYGGLRKNGHDTL